MCYHRLKRSYSSRFSCDPLLISTWWKAAKKKERKKCICHWAVCRAETSSYQASSACCLKTTGSPTVLGYIKKLFSSSLKLTMDLIWLDWQSGVRSRISTTLRFKGQKLLSLQFPAVLLVPLVNEKVQQNHFKGEGNLNMWVYRSETSKRSGLGTCRVALTLIKSLFTTDWSSTGD